MHDGKQKHGGHKEDAVICWQHNITLAPEYPHKQKSGVSVLKLQAKEDISADTFRQIKEKSTIEETQCMTANKSTAVTK